MKLRFVAGLLVISSISLNAHALKIDMKPGLWEHAFKFDKNSMGAMGGAQQDQMNKAMEEMKTQMANLPPEQRKMMEDMMAKQGIKVSDKGIDMAAQGLSISKDGTKVKACVTQADIDRGAMPQADVNCEQKITQISASQFKTTYVCKGEHPAQGEGEITFQNDKAYTGKMKMVTQVNGKPETIQGDNSGKWLSSDCGNIKPVTQIK
jgi:uncharacterized protein YneF (UPF0154 family)